MSILRVKLIGGSVATSQDIQHRFFYANSDGNDASQEDLDQFNVAFTNDVVDTLVTIMGNDVQYFTLETYCDSCALISFTDYVPNKVGSRPGSSEPPFFVQRYLLKRSTLGARSGRKAFSGVIAPNFAPNGGITDANQQLASTDVELALAQLLVLPNTTIMAPILTRNYDPITGLAESASAILSTTYSGLSTQNSRKLKGFLT